LRLDLAQYRELAAFARFGAELGDSVRRQLLRGERLTEILKQDESQPLPVDRQLLIVYAGVNGFLDDVPVDRVREFERGLLQYFGRFHAELSVRLPGPERGRACRTRRGNPQVSGAVLD
jgi:F-type H+-transporting ATPase subunit alpha